MSQKSLPRAQRFIPDKVQTKTLVEEHFREEKDDQMALLAEEAERINEAYSAESWKRFNEEEYESFLSDFQDDYRLPEMNQEDFDWIPEDFEADLCLFFEISARVAKEDPEAGQMLKSIFGEHISADARKICEQANNNNPTIREKDRIFFDNVIGDAAEHAIENSGEYDHLR